MQKITLALVMISSCLTISACQPKVEKPNAASIEIDAQASAQTPVKAEDPKVDQDTSVKAQTCIALNQAMQKVGDNSKIEAIHGIQKQLKACLPTANNAEVMTLLKSYQAMYDRFLDTGGYMDYENLDTIVEAMDKGIKVSAEQLKVLEPRTQYLIKLAEDKADVNILYVGEGLFVFHCNLKAMADIFAPYLTENQRAFTQRMAKDNQDIFWSDAAVAVSYDEVIDRAIFWEDYIKSYPNSYFIKDAKSLFKLYRYTLFFGSDNTDWLVELYREFYEPKHEQLIKKLSQRSDSTLGQDARNLLRFMKMSDDERQESYPVDIDTTDANNEEWASWSIASEQLDLALLIPSPWQETSANRDCMSSIICVNYDY